MIRRFDQGITGVGSLPFDEAGAWDFVRRHTPRIPYVPEPSLGCRHHGLVSPFADGLDRVHGSLSIDERGFAAFDNRLSVDSVHDQIILGTEAESHNPHHLAPCTFPEARIAKTQLIGPITLCSAISHRGKSIMSNRRLRDGTLSWLLAAARARIETARTLHPSAFLVLDEPMFGAELDLDGNEIRMLAELVQEIRGEHIPVIIHTCQTGGWDEIWIRLLSLRADGVSGPIQSLLALTRESSLAIRFLDHRQGYILGLLDPAPSPAPSLTEAGGVADELSKLCACDPSFSERLAFSPTCGLLLQPPARAEELFVELASLVQNIVERL